MVIVRYFLYILCFSLIFSSSTLACEPSLIKFTEKNESYLLVVTPKSAPPLIDGDEPLENSLEIYQLDSFDDLAQMLSGDRTCEIEVIEYQDGDDLT